MTKFTPELRAAIARDKRKYREIAVAFGVTFSYVRVVKQRAGLAGTREHPNRSKPQPPRKPLPQRHYIPSWALPADDQSEARS